VPTIFDNIEHRLLDALSKTLPDARAADLCVGYFHLRAWRHIGPFIEHFAGDDHQRCRLLIGMQKPPEQLMRELQSVRPHSQRVDGPTLARLKREVVEHFREQLEFGVPTTEAEATLRLLARQIRASKVQIKLFLGYPLHAKLYLVHRPDPVAPLIAYLGSSNLTVAGLSAQGELNIDVLEQDAAHKLFRWFEERWQDPACLDISTELAQLIETSWAREELLLPYLVYLKMAYHLSEDARIGERQFKLPKELQGVLADFQAAAVQLVARLLYKHGGVLLGDVVGLGKTLMATAVAKVFQEDDRSNTLIICPPKLQEHWQGHADAYGLAARVLSLGQVREELPRLPRFRTLIIDESHNLRNREGKRWRAIKEYVDLNEPRVILVTATPYNKHFLDLSNQLRLFLDEDQDLGVRPERFFQELAQQGESELDFVARFQTSPRSLRAFEQSLFPDDWRDLMRLFMVRRPRAFIIRNYATYDPARNRYYILLKGERSYFPLRQPKTLTFSLNEQDPADQYARLFRDEVVQVIERLALPRYGLANYLVRGVEREATAGERRILDNLNRAGRRLIGFCRTNLFKRLESSGHSFLLSVHRHLLRNLVSLSALQNGLPLPIGTQEAALLDAALNDADPEFTAADEEADEEEIGTPSPEAAPRVTTLESYYAQAAAVYQSYSTQFKRRFHWLPARFFTPELVRDLRQDAETLWQVLQQAGHWDPVRDAKLMELYRLLTERHSAEKVLVFTQFADTALYLGQQLKARGLQDFAVVTSQSSDPVALARRFSPSTNRGLRPGETELRALIATDVLAEGQNLQDAYIVVNYDLPWAIIRLIQRAGRVDRIGQAHDTILVYSFLPAEGVERIIRLRQRLFYRLQANQEVIGTDESFFGEVAAQKLIDLYTEKQGVFDDDSGDEDVDLTSLALQAWNSAPATLQEQVKKLPNVVYATRAHPTGADTPPGVIVHLRFVRNNEKHDLLLRLDPQGNLVSQSLVALFRAAACPPGEPALLPTPNHHELVARAVEYAIQELQTVGGQLGTLRSIRRKVYERLRAYCEHQLQRPDLFAQESIPRIETLLGLLYRAPLKEDARDTLSRQLRLGIPDHELVELVWDLYQDGRLCKEPETSEPLEPQVLCSLGLVPVNATSTSRKGVAHGEHGTLPRH
jgi:hypothetical protein